MLIKKSILYQFFIDSIANICLLLSWHLYLSCLYTAYKMKKKKKRKKDKKRDKMEGRKQEDCKD